MNISFIEVDEDTEKLEKDSRPIFFNLPRPESYWSFSNFKDTGDNNEAEIFLQVGSVCSQWERLEATLSVLYSWFLIGEGNGGRATEIARRAYGYFTATGARKSVLLDAAKIYLSHSDEELLRQIEIGMNHVERAATIRNRIVHASAVEIHIDNKSRGYFICPSMHSSKSIKSYFDKKEWDSIAGPEDPFSGMPYRYRYVSKDIELLSEKLILLTQCFMQLSSYLMHRDIVERQENFARRMAQ